MKNIIQKIKEQNDRKIRIKENNPEIEIDETALNSRCKDCEFTVSGVLKVVLEETESRWKTVKSTVKAPSSKIVPEIPSTIHFENPQNTKDHNVLKFEKTVKACEDNCDICMKDEAD